MIPIIVIVIALPTLNFFDKRAQKPSKEVREVMAWGGALCVVAISVASTLLLVRLAS